MNDSELLKRVKSILMISGDEFDGTIRPLMLGVKGYMLGAGVSAENIASDNGIVTLAIGTNDLWQLSSGEARYSPGFLNMIKQLQLQ